MKWQNILEAVFAFPSLVLEEITESIEDIRMEEKELIEHGEFEE